MFLSLDHSNWNSREINWNNIRRKSHYSWRKRDVWPNSSWRMARKSKTFQITPIQVHSLCNANSHDSRSYPSMPCTGPLLCWRDAICIIHGTSAFGLTDSLTRVIHAFHRRALLLLKKKHYQDQLLDKTDSQIANLERMVGVDHIIWLYLKVLNVIHTAMCLQ